MQRLVRSPGSRSPRRCRLCRWLWAYRKLKSLECTCSTAAYRATRFALFGSTGRCCCNRGLLKVNLHSRRLTAGHADAVGHQAGQ
ncbi:hypothetical protein [Pseudomonas citronellolis]|uniref:hypothetical protein n=1 Tax=Pseudomonas citronellolis TaxID=53408 RepID=UPI0023E42E89|nr:hypothetical protein [Pseudomonas citronellolis]MDF3934299.1 hypothetical protein [Pseudomonas citronellolis]